MMTMDDLDPEAYRAAMASRDDRHWVYKREGLPCRVCGTDIVLEELGGRKLYWCPYCQAERSRTDRMRQNPSFTLASDEGVKRLIREHPWMTIVSMTDAAGLVASHYPVLLDETARRASRCSRTSAGPTRSCTSSAGTR